jgi:hypothetical protein
MDIGELRVACPRPSLGVAFDGANPLKIVLAVLGVIVRVCLSVAAILSALGSLSRL